MCAVFLNWTFKKYFKTNIKDYVFVGYKIIKSTKLSISGYNCNSGNVTHIEIKIVWPKEASIN